jgi:hypothetical protein
MSFLTAKTRSCSIDTESHGILHKKHNPSKDGSVSEALPIEQGTPPEKEKGRRVARGQRVVGRG